MRLVVVCERARTRIRLLLFACLAHALVGVPMSVLAASPTAKGEVLTFEGACDASAVTLLAQGDLLVGDDANNILRIYSPAGGGVKSEIDVYALTEVGALSKRNTSAIEGVARRGDRIYWIGSHARTRKKGKNRPNRRRLFSLRVTGAAGQETAQPVGRSYVHLSADLAQAPKLAPLLLEHSIMLMHRDLDYLSPDRNGLKIGGLAVTRDEVGLLIGLRNPLQRSSAIVVPLRNPQDLVAGAEHAYFGDPMLLDLGGMGIASMEYAPARGGYYILAGRKGQEQGYRLYSWSGNAEAAPVLVQDLASTGLNAQAMAIAADGKRAIVLSDDGSSSLAVSDWSECRRGLDQEGRCACSDVQDASRKSFRGMWLELP